MRSFLFPLLLCCSVAQAASSTYFPNTLGMQWRYSNGETQQVGKPRVVKGVGVVPVAHSVAGVLISEDLLEYRGGAVYLRGVQAGGKLNWYAPPLQVYPAAPLAPGQTWTSATSAGMRLNGSVIGTQAIKTAAGSYNTLIIRSEVISQAKAGSAQNANIQDVYFVPGLGVVRFRTADGSTVDLIK